MLKVVFLVGLPGSGKTHTGIELAKKSNVLGLFDDISVDKKAFDAFKYHLRRSEGSIDAISVQWPLNGTLIVADVNLCEAYQRQLAEKLVKSVNPEIKIEWIFFENAPDKCRKNVARRNDGRDVEGSIVRFSKSYTIPEGITPHEVWTNG